MTIPSGRGARRRAGLPWPVATWPARGELPELDISAPWAARTAWIALAVGVLMVIVFTIVVQPFDFGVYRWGGQAIAHDLHLYLVQDGNNWFTYTPFAAALFIPIAAIPDLLGRVGWQLISLAALVFASVSTFELAGYRLTRTALAGIVAVGISLEPMYHTFYLGQINVILLALILIDISRAARGQPAGIGVGIAAAIKLTPLIFIALFLLGHRVKDAMIAGATFVACGLIGYLVAPQASSLYWRHLFYDTDRVGGAYISNQSPYSAALRIAGGAAQVGTWFVLIPALLGVAGLIVAAVLARHDDWLGAATMTGATSLLVSPVSWTHHWVWILPALVILVQGGTRSRIAAAGGYVLFVLAPMWFTPRDGGPSEYGFHWLMTLVANCYLVAGLAFYAYMGWRAYVLRRDGGGPPFAADAAVPAMIPAQDL